MVSGMATWGTAERSVLNFSAERSVLKDNLRIFLWHRFQEMFAG